MPKFFIHHPIFAIVIAIAMVIIGVLAALGLPVAQYPKISPPTVNVTTNYIGANAAVVNETVAQVIEQQVNGTEGMDYMSSNSDDGGNYSLSVVFGLESDADMDTVKTQNNVAIASNSLPSEVTAYGVKTKKASPDLAFVCSIRSPKGTYTRQFMKNYADIYIIDKLKRVPGVGDVMVWGPDYAMRIWLNPDKLAEYGLTIADVTTAIRRQNVQAPAGTIGMMPAPEAQEKQMPGRVVGRLVTDEEFGNIIVRSAANGSFVKMKDFARIETGARSESIEAFTNRDTSIGFGIQLTSDANAMDTVTNVQKILSEAARDFPPDMEYTEIVDSTKYIRASIREVAQTFIEALVLVTVILFLFLQNWRSTLIPALVVPVSIIATFGAFVILDFSINTLTLFAMVLAIGLVVDDAIVVIENVERNMMEKHLSSVEATEVAMDEVEGAVIATTFVLAAVFVPVAFLGGMMGVLYRQFALTITISVTLSTFLALTLTPALCGVLLKEHDPGARSGPFASFFNWFNDWFDRVTKKYSGGVAWIIHRLRLAAAALLVIVALTGMLYKLLPSTFIPAEDKGYFIVSIAMPEGTSLNRTRNTSSRLAEKVRAIPGVQTVMEVNGSDILSGGRKSNSALFFVGLEEWGERAAVQTSIDAVIGSTFRLGRTETPEAFVIAFNPPALPGLGIVGGFNMQLLDMAGHTDTELDEITKRIVAAANQRPELQGVYSTYSVNSPICEFQIDREKVMNLGVNLSDVFTALQTNFGGYEVNDFNRFGRTYKVVLQSDTSYRTEAEAAKFVFVKSESGTLVPLDTLLTPKFNTGASVISRFNAARSITVQGSEAPGYSSGQALAALEEVVRDNAPEGFNVDWSGQSREERKAGSKTMDVLALALVFSFLCLAALYESWSTPFAILATVPTGIFGALASEFVLRQQNSIYMQIGIIMIIGLAAKNAILIVEFAKERVDKGEDPVSAALEGARLRLRPIMMTALTTIIGTFPLAIATGAGAGARNNMGIAVVGGMTFATVLGVFLIPVFYVIVEKAARAIKGKQA